MSDATLPKDFHHQLAKVFVEAAIDIGCEEEPWETMPARKRGAVVWCVLAMLEAATPVIERLANQKMRRALELCREAPLAPWQQRAVEEALGETEDRKR
jgi:hypothetical protein